MKAEKFNNKGENIRVAPPRKSSGIIISREVGPKKPYKLMAKFDDRQQN